MKYRNWRLFGRNCGQRCTVSPAAVSTVVRGSGTPPDADTRQSGPIVPNRMTPSAFQVPPLADGASQIVAAGPPAASTRLSFALAKKPTCLLSGDQKGNVASSVEGSGCAVSE